MERIVHVTNNTLKQALLDGGVRGRLFKSSYQGNVYRVNNLVDVAHEGIRMDIEYVGYIKNKRLEEYELEKDSKFMLRHFNDREVILEGEQ